MPDLLHITTDISGSIGTGTPSWSIYQRNGKKLTRYPGPKIPNNPRSRNQQLNRRLFSKSVETYVLLSEEQRQAYREVALSLGGSANPLTLFHSRFKKQISYNSSFYNEGLFGIPNPDAGILYYSEEKYSANFYLTFDSAPRRKRFNESNFNESIYST